MPKVLVIDDDRTVLHMLQRSLTEPGVEVLTCDRAAQGLKLLEEQRPDVVLLDVLMPEMSGLQAIEQIKQIDSKLPVVFITAGERSEMAIEAMKLGAFDYLPKPLDLSVVHELVEQALESRRFMNVPVKVLDDGEKESPADEGDGEVLVGRSKDMLNVYKSVGRVAPQDVTVLIRGESGTGKELVARAIYHHGKRAEGCFLAVNCAALPDSLLESELFGHEKGAFTGADQQRIGKFERCSGGTIFLDEIGDMSPLVQSKVLRLLQQQEFERVGGNETIKTDVRVIAATNRDLEQMVKDSEFRADLFYRLNGFTIKLPPLRERRDDLEILLEHFLPKYNREFHKEIQSVSPEAMKLIEQYDWPGNVREFQSVLKQALLKSTGPTLIAEFLPEEVRTGQSGVGQKPDNGLPTADLAGFVDERLRAESHDLYAETLELMERYVLTRTLKMSGGNQSQTAKTLGITRGSLRHKIRALGIRIDQVVKVAGEHETENGRE